jgi:hypothetical protein
MCPTRDLVPQGANPSLTTGEHIERNRECKDALIWPGYPAGTDRPPGA